MSIDFDKTNGTAKITMSSYLHEVINESGMDIRQVAATPTTSNLFEHDLSTPALVKKEANIFWHIACMRVVVCWASWLLMQIF